MAYEEEKQPTSGSKSIAQYVRKSFRMSTRTHTSHAIDKSEYHKEMVIARITTARVWTRDKAYVA